MLKINTNTRIGINLLGFIILFMGCEPEEVSYTNDYILFENSIQISIPEYTYADNGVVYKVGGDSSYTAKIIDTLSSKPEFHWLESSATFLMAAIFSDSIRVNAYNILNTEDIIWRWNTGMEFESSQDLIGDEYKYVTSVLYEDGKRVNNDTILESEPESLESGDYYYAIWGWSGDAKKITYSTILYHFYVKE